MCFNHTHGQKAANLDELIHMGFYNHMHHFQSGQCPCVHYLNSYTTSLIYHHFLLLFLIMSGDDLDFVFKSYMASIFVPSTLKLYVDTWYS